MPEKEKKVTTIKFTEGMVVNGKKVLSKIDWKVYFDTHTNKPVGAGYAVYCSALDENLPPLKDSPPYIKVRKAVMLILDE